MLKSVCVSVHIALVLPQVWRVENVARLLVLCGTTLCYSVLANKAHNGRLFEISKLLVYLILVRMSSLIQIKKDTFKASYLPQSHNIILLLCLSNHSMYTCIYMSNILFIFSQWQFSGLITSVFVWSLT